MLILTCQGAKGALLVATTVGGVAIGGAAGQGLSAAVSPSEKSLKNQ